MTDEMMLDNPIWRALNSEHRPMMQGKGLAARYPADVARFAGLADLSREAFCDLAPLVQVDEPIALFTSQPPEPPSEWRVLRERPLEQMICHRLSSDSPSDFTQLGSGDVPDMLALAAATEPGPFSSGTITMGRYFGIRSDDGRLAAMSGERLRLTGYTEISAVCTDPAFRGRGYARSLVMALCIRILTEGSTPFLHVKTENGAKGLYESLGFHLRQIIHLTVLALRP